jgi:hypothetical protein
MNGSPRVRAALTVLAALVAPALAQERELRVERGTEVLCTLRCAAYAGGTAAAGAGFARLEVENHDRAEHRAVVTLSRQRGGIGSDVRIASTFELAPLQRAVVFVPLPRPPIGMELALDVDGFEQKDELPMAQAEGLLALLLSDRPDATPVALGWLQGLEATPAPTVLACRAEDAPADWRLYTGFDAVFVDGRTRLSGDVQQALRRAACAGSTVVVAGGTSLPAGELRQAAAAAGRGGVAAHGAGRIVAMLPFDAPPSPSVRSLRTLVDRLEPPVAPAVARATQHVPGLGAPPVAVFLLVIVLFAVLVGPVNFLLLRRWRRPLLALVTVPALGLGTTLAILGYGLLHDGFGVRGVTASWTWLDQERHEAAVLSMHTLFAGRAPSALAMGPDSLLLAPRAVVREPGGSDRWHLDPARGELDGGALPSRTSTPLIGRQHGAARERLLAQRSGDGTLRLLTDAGVAPRGIVVLRDLDGEYWAGTAPLLRRASANDAENALGELARRGALVTIDAQPEPEREPWRRRGREPREPLAGPQRVAAGARLFAFPLEPGTWVAELERAPWLDLHGLTVRHDQQRHFARGRMQAGDFVP